MALPFHILFTDLDGTLLDESTYAFEAARPALRALQERNIPIVFCTSKTFVETVPLQAAMGVSDPFIVENGGAIYFKQGQLELPEGAMEPCGAWCRLGLGMPYEAVVTRLAAIRKETGLRLRGFAQMEVAEIAADCGLSLEVAGWAKQREYDEPFRLLEATPEALARIGDLTQAMGLTLTSGGRYQHLAGGSDKGRAVRTLCESLPKVHGSLRSVGLGDSPNDLPMLAAVDCPVVVMRPGGTHHPRLLAGLPHAVRASGVGPAGWNDAVLGLLAEEGDDEG